MSEIVESVEGKVAMRDRIQRLEDEALKLPQVEIPVQHYFAHGLYGRKIVIPKGTILTGKIHKYSTLDVVMRGSISVIAEDGVPRLITAPAVLESKPGAKKAGYAHEETEWITIHGTEKTEVEEILEEHIVETYEQFLSFCGLAPQIEEK